MYERKIPRAVDPKDREWHDRETWQVVAMLLARIPDDRTLREQVLKQMDKGAIYQTDCALYRKKRGA